MTDGFKKLASTLNALAEHKFDELPSKPEHVAEEQLCEAHNYVKSRIRNVSMNKSFDMRMASIYPIRSADLIAILDDTIKLHPIDFKIGFHHNSEFKSLSELDAMVLIPKALSAQWMVYTYPLMDLDKPPIAKLMLVHNYSQEKIEIPQSNLP